MAVEDGAALGTLISLGQKSASPPDMPSALKLYEKIRKDRSALQLKGALQNRDLYHLWKDDEVEERKKLLKTLTWDDRQPDFPWLWGDMKYQNEINGYDSIKAAKKAYEERSGEGTNA